MLIKDTKNTLRNEGAKNCFFRILKVISLKTFRFFRSVPCIIHSWFTDMIIKDILDYKMKLYLSDKGISRELYTYGKREFLATDLMTSGKIAQESDVVLDIGANIGYYALMEAQLVGDKGLVYAIEPSPPNFKILSENIELNSQRNIRAYHMAIGDYCGTAEMFISNKSNWSRLSDKGLPDHIKTKVEVPITTVDEFLKDKLSPNLLRMDVEGYEINVLKGMEETLKTTSIKIFVELHPHLMNKDEINSFFDILKKHSYHVEYCFLNPSTEQNPLTKLAYRMLDETGDYEGVMLDFTLEEAREWTLTHNFKRLPHFLFSKSQ